MSFIPETEDPQLDPLALMTRIAEQAVRMGERLLAENAELRRENEQLRLQRRPRLPRHARTSSAPRGGSR